MIKYLFTIALLLFALNSRAQVCELPNGDLEVWVDFTAELQELSPTPLPAETLIAPEGFASGLRFFFIIFSTIFEEFGVENVLPNLFGTIRSTDASEGEFALQLGADQFFPTADLVTVNACNGTQPTAFTLDLRHVGNITDTLLIVGSFGETAGLPETEEQINDFSAFFLQEIISNETTEYQNIFIPIVSNENEISADSFTLFFLLSSNEVSLSLGDTSFFLLDNLQFQGDESTTSTKELSLPSPVEVYPTVFQQEINITNNNNSLEAIVYTLNGQRKATLTIPSGQSSHDLSFINHPGSYLLKMADPETGRSVTKILMKQ